jgi:Tfp pilus assembly protein PilF
VIRYVFVLLSFALGLMAKPMLVSLPLVLLLIDYWPLRRVGQASGPRAWRRLLVEKVPFLALSAASSIVTFLVQTKAGTVAAVTAVPLSARLANVSVSYIAYLEKALVPVGLSPLYRFSFHLPAWQVAGSALLLVLATGAAFWGGRRHRYLVTGWLWYVVTVLPVSGLVQVGGQAMADRYTYLPLIGIAIMAVWGFRDLIEGLAASAGSGVQGAGEASRLPPRGLWRFLGLGRDARPTTLARLQFGVSGAILLCLAVATRHYVGYWRDSFTLFSRALTVNEANDTAHFNVGLWLATKEGKPREAADHFRRAVQLNAHHAPSRYSLGLCLAQLGDLAGAAQAYREALAVDPAYAFAHHNLAILLEREGEWPAALEQYEAALKASPQDGVMRQNLANAHNKFGAALKQQGDLKAAEAQFLAATGVEPGHTIARANLAQTFFDEGRYAEAWQAVELCRRYGGSPPPSLLTNLSLRLPQPRPQP